MKREQYMRYHIKVKPPLTEKGVEQILNEVFAKYYKDWD